MNRVKFLNRLDIKYQDLNIADEYGAEFKRFFGLNEANSELLTEKEKADRDNYRDRLMEDDDLREKYYLFHLLKTYNTKWRHAQVDDIVNHWYNKSVIIRGLYE